MKKTIIILAIIISILCLNKEEKIIIPQESIRFRIIANSNAPKDQIIKKKLLNNLTTSTNLLSYESKNLSSTRSFIQENIPYYEKIITQTLEEESPTTKYKINYGTNYFPEKEYNDVIYEEGYYESLVITLGEGTGDNFWCVLFPPLCLIEQEETKSSKIEYKSYIKEIIDKYF